jgi:hypothetical protein
VRGDYWPCLYVRALAERREEQLRLLCDEQERRLVPVVPAGPRSAPQYPRTCSTTLRGHGCGTNALSGRGVAPLTDRRGSLDIGGKPARALGQSVCLAECFDERGQ